MSKNPVLAELQAIRRLLEKQLEPAPAALTFKRAAKALGVGLTKFTEMRHDGIVRTVQLGGKEMVARTEIDRLTKPAAPRVTSVQGKRVDSIQNGTDAKAELAQLIRRKAR